MYKSNITYILPNIVKKHLNNKETFYLPHNSQYLCSLNIEVCFVDTKTNADAYKKNFDKCCKAIAETLSGKKLKEDPKPVKVK